MLLIRHFPKTLLALSLLVVDVCVAADSHALLGRL